VTRVTSPAMSCDVTRDPTRVAREATRDLTGGPTARTISQTPRAPDANYGSRCATLAT
jgi:hypothetical protein